MSGDAGDFWLMDGATLDTDPARVDPKAANHRLKLKAAEKPAGEWNLYEITMHGSSVLLKVNGVVVNEGTGADEAAGRIALQSEGTPIEFRNIRLTPITAVARLAREARLSAPRHPRRRLRRRPRSDGRTPPGSAAA
jgi:Domain of Unknown Function (DUF1080)